MTGIQEDRSETVETRLALEWGKVWSKTFSQSRDMIYLVGCGTDGRLWELLVTKRKMISRD